jgi:hypothetical protein
MKTIAYLILPLLFMACVNKATENTPTEPQQATFELHEDRVNCVITAAVPDVQGDLQSTTLVRQAVGEWFDEALGGCYDGDPCDMQALVDFYGKAKTDSLKAALEDPNPYVEVEFEATMTKAFETDRIVTYTLEKYVGLGGAHPVSFSEGATFRKTDGRRLGWDIVKRDKTVELNEILKNSLMQYVGTDNEEELTTLTFIENIYGIPLTNTPPFFLDNGLVFVYQQYEIAAYAMGMPTDTIPYKEIKPLLTHTAQQLIP